eukprot:125660-Rhodomonas_salina.1
MAAAPTHTRCWHWPAPTPPYSQVPSSLLSCYAMSRGTTDLVYRYTGCYDCPAGATCKGGTSFTALSG